MVFRKDRSDNKSTEKVDRKERKERLEKILAYVNDYIIHPDFTLNRIRPEIIFYIVKIYADKINFHLNEDTITFERFFGEKYFPLGDFFEDYAKLSAIELEMPIKISLSRDPVLTEIWKAESHAKALNEVATPTNPWVQQDDHWFSLYLPMGVTVVYNGNHSANCGIIKGEGELIFDPANAARNQMYDMSHLYEDYYYDGTLFRRKSDRSFKMPGSFESGCIFELGRIIHENKLSFFSVLRNRKI